MQANLLRNTMLTCRRNDAYSDANLPTWWRTNVLTQWRDPVSRRYKLTFLPSSPHPSLPSLSSQGIKRPSSLTTKKINSLGILYYQATLRLPWLTSTHFLGNEARWSLISSTPTCAKFESLLVESRTTKPAQHVTGQAPSICPHTSDIKQRTLNLSRLRVLDGTGHLWRSLCRRNLPSYSGGAVRKHCIGNTAWQYTTPRPNKWRHVGVQQRV